MASEGRISIGPLIGEGQRWVEALYATMQRARLPVGEVILADGVLRASMVPETWAPMTVTIRTVKGDTPSWSRTDRFAIGFDGASELSPYHERLLGVVHKIVGRLEAHMPRRLDGFAAIGISGYSPREVVTRAFPFVTIESSAIRDVGDVTEVLVRTTSRCNQRCPFCSGPLHDEPSTAMVSACLDVIDELLPGATVTLTGGEPTVKAGFEEEVARALAMTTPEAIQIQSNGVGFDTLVDPLSIPRDERLRFFVSLHALDEARYDACTGTTGQLRSAIRGIRRLLAASHDVTVNVLVCRINIDHIEEMMAAIPRVFEGGALPHLHFSVLICPEWRPEAASFLVPYGRLVPTMERTIEIARDAGIGIDTLLSSTHASVPPCLVSEEHRGTGRHAPEVEKHETGYEAEGTPWVKALRCRTCREDSHCLGVPRPYAEAFGLDELTPLTGGA